LHFGQATFPLSYSASVMIKLNVFVHPLQTY